MRRAALDATVIGVNGAVAACDAWMLTLPDVPAWLRAGDAASMIVCTAMVGLRVCASRAERRAEREALRARVADAFD